MKRVIIAGASGLIGNELLTLLLKDKNIKEVRALVRAPLSINHAKLIQIIVNFDLPEKWITNISGDVVYCCLGSTMKKTPDLKEYRKVDHDYPVLLAQIASENNIPQFHLVSASGADQHSRIFYNKLKGDTEKDIAGYKFHSIHIYQPALLTGNRKEKRIFEKFAIYAMNFINPILVGRFKKYRSIPASIVAKAMLNQTFKNLRGAYTYPSDVITKLA